MDSPNLATKQSAAISAASTLSRGDGAGIAVKDAQDAIGNKKRVAMASQELKAIGAPKY